MSTAKTTLWHSYWFRSQVEPARLIALRWILYGLVAYDLWTVMLPHASRYGAGHFNVAQVGLLDILFPVPTPGVVSAIVLTTSIACALAALGILAKAMAVASCLGYFGLYLWSQADSYQHHYLIGLMLLIACFLPRSHLSPSVEEKNEADCAHWAIPLLYVQIAIVYFWTAVTKIDDTWMTGLTMSQLTGEPAVRSLIAQMESMFSLQTGGGYRLAAGLVVVGEFFAAIVFLVPRLRLLGLFIVPWFHVGVELLGVDIELFSYYMIALNLVLLSPPRFWQWVGIQIRKSRRITTPLTGWPSNQTYASVLAVLCGLAVFLLIRSIPMSSSIIAATLGGVFTLSALVGYRQRPTALIALGCLLMAGSMTYTIAASESAYDFYRLWGGDLRRRNNIELAIDKYQRANRIKTSGPARHLQQGELHERLGQYAEANAAFGFARLQLEDHVNRLMIRSNQAPTDGNLHLELAENQLRLEQRCRALLRSVGYTGTQEDLKSARVCASNARLAAKASLKAAREGLIQPNLKQRKSMGRIQRQLNKKSR